MTATSDRRLIEDYLPVDWLSAEASGEPEPLPHEEGGGGRSLLRRADRRSGAGGAGTAG